MGGISSRALISENSYQTFIAAMLMCFFGNYNIRFRERKRILGHPDEEEERNRSECCDRTEEIFG